MSEATNDGIELSTQSQNADPEKGAGETKPKRRHPGPFENETWRSLRWLMLFLLSLLAGCLDPLFFYIPVMNDNETCVRSDKKLGVIAIVLRTYFDVVHTFFWLLCYEDWIRVPLKKWWICIAKKCGCSCIGESKTGDVNEAREADATFTVKEKSATDEKSERSMKLRVMKIRVIEFASVLPLPQIVTILIILRSGSPRFTNAVSLLKFSVLSQLIVRALRVYPSYKGATRHSLFLLEGRVWVGSALNLLLFVIASHAVGAFWYLLSLGRSMDCWRNACSSHVGCDIASLYCGSVASNKSFLNTTCPIDSSSDTPPFDFGIYLVALKSRIVSSNDFPLKLGYCFWWGLRNLSSLGQNLSTSAYLWEVCFAISISVIGLILFSLFIGNMQMFLQSQTNDDLKEMKAMMEKRKSLDKWKPFSILSNDLQGQILSCNDSRWLESKDVDLRSILENVPAILSQQIKWQLCFPLLSRILVKEEVDKGPLKVLCKLTRPVVFAERNSIPPEDDLIDKMYFIVGGKLCCHGKEGNTLYCTEKFLGVELLRQALDGEQSSNSPPQFLRKTIVAQTKVEAFSITALDIKKVRSQFRGRFYKWEKEGRTNPALQKPVSQRKAVSLTQPARNNTVESRMQFSNDIIEGVSCPQIREDDPHP